MPENAPLPTETPLRQPQSAGEIFRVFNRLSMQGFGGVLAIAQRELVDRERWLTREQFVEMFSISQMLPGPNIVNLSLMIGDRHFGLRGAAAALAGMLLGPMVIVVLLAALYGQFADVPLVARALRGMGAVAAGLVIGAGLKLLGTLKKNAMGMGVSLVYAALTIAALGVLHWPLLWVVLGLGGLGMLTAWWKLRKALRP